MKAGGDGAGSVTISKELHPLGHSTLGQSTGILWDRAQSCGLYPPVSFFQGGKYMIMSQKMHHHGKYSLTRNEWKNVLVRCETESFIAALPLGRAGVSGQAVF